ncbi:hypothetical protein V1505DRAFT_375066 [Lipomyces doorenjongii]
MDPVEGSGFRKPLNSGKLPMEVGTKGDNRVEGSHGAIKRGLTSSSGSLYTAGKMNRQDNDRAQHLSIEGSNEALFVRQEIRNQIETSKLCTAISRSGLKLVYGKVMKKMQQQQEDGSWETCTCSAWHRYLLPCSHRIQLGVPISVTGHSSSLVGVS